MWILFFEIVINVDRQSEQSKLNHRRLKEIMKHDWMKLYWNEQNFRLTY